MQERQQEELISEINNTVIDNAKDIDGVMPIYYLIEYIDNYSKISGILWQCCGYMSGEGDNAAITDSESFKSKVKITEKISTADM